MYGLKLCIFTYQEGFLQNDFWHFANIHNILKVFIEKLQKINDLCSLEFCKGDLHEMQSLLRAHQALQYEVSLRFQSKLLTLFLSYCFSRIFNSGDVLAKSAQNCYLKVIPWQLKGAFYCLLYLFVRSNHLFVIKKSWGDFATTF